jgi:hypothetical protein
MATGGAGPADYKLHVSRTAELLQYTVDVESWLAYELHPWLVEMEQRIRAVDQLAALTPPQPPPPPWSP